MRASELAQIGVQADVSPGASGGKSARFSGVAGSEYARSQEGERADDKTARFFAAWQARFFQPYVKDTDRVLDFGCGTGRILAALRAGEKIGVDANLAAHPLCEKRDIRAVSAVEDLLGEPPFDVVMSNHALEHIPRPLDALVSLRQVLRPGGKLVLMTPIDDWRSRRQRSWDDDDWDRHLYTWTPRLMGNLLTEAGFAVQEIRIIRSAWDPRIVFLRRLGPAVFSAACWATAILLRRRQLLAVCRCG